MKVPLPKVEVVIEVPRGGFIKRSSHGRLEFVSPLPCPYNYGSVPAYRGGDGDLLDAIVLGPRLERGRRVTVTAYGAVGFTDNGIYDDKLICSQRAVPPRARRRVVAFLHFYAFCKRLFHRSRGHSECTACLGWGDARQAIERAHPR